MEEDAKPVTLENLAAKILATMQVACAVDPRARSIAITHLETAMLWWAKAIAAPVRARALSPIG
jgi:hypothetical protein